MHYPKVIVWESGREWTDRLRGTPRREWVVSQVTNESDCELALRTGSRVVLVVQIASGKSPQAQWLLRGCERLVRPPIVAICDSIKDVWPDLPLFGSALGVRWIADPDHAVASLIEVLARLLSSPIDSPWSPPDSLIPGCDDRRGLARAAPTGPTPSGGGHGASGIACR